MNRRAKGGVVMTAVEERESLDDYTARALLMPLESVYRLLLKNDYVNAGPIQRASCVMQLCERYSVSRENAMKRIKEVCILKHLER